MTDRFTLGTVEVYPIRAHWSAATYVYRDGVFIGPERCPTCLGPIEDAGSDGRFVEKCTWYIWRAPSAGIGGMAGWCTLANERAALERTINARRG